MGRRILSGLFFAALTALLAWAAVTGAWSRLTDLPRQWLQADASVCSESSEEDVLFDDDSTVDWSEPVTDVFDPLPSTSTDLPSVELPKTYEFALTPAYFNALLEKYSDGIPIREICSSFASGQVVLSGRADVDALKELLDIPAALVIFLPKQVDCQLTCVPRVEQGRLRVTVSKVWAGSDVLAPFLGGAEVLSAVEGFLNDLLTKYLPSQYEMRSASVTEEGMYVRFSVRTEE